LATQEKEPEKVPAGKEPHPSRLQTSSPHLTLCPILSLPDLETMAISCYWVLRLEAGMTEWIIMREREQAWETVLQGKTQEALKLTSPLCICELGHMCFHVLLAYGQNNLLTELYKHPHDKQNCTNILTTDHTIICRVF